jgi:hypothetical protein
MPGLGYTLPRVTMPGEFTVPGVDITNQSAPRRTIFGDCGGPAPELAIVNMGDPAGPGLAIVNTGDPAGPRTRDRQ